MANRTLNRATIIGNVARKPELNKTPNGDSVCTFYLITNTEYKKGDITHEESKSHVCVAWGRLAEICAEMLEKGTLAFVDGRLSDHEFTDKSGAVKTQTEIIVSEMIILNSKTGEREDVSN